jgi:hypothetical protein
MNLSAGIIQRLANRKGGGLDGLFPLQGGESYRNCAADLKSYRVSSDWRIRRYRESVEEDPIRGRQGDARLGEDRGGDTFSGLNAEDGVSIENGDGLLCGRLAGEQDENGGRSEPANLPHGLIIYYALECCIHTFGST